MEIAPPWAYWVKEANFGITDEQAHQALQAYYAAVTFTERYWPLVQLTTPVPVVCL